MSGSVNKVIIVGRLGRDVETRTFANGGKVCNLRVACSESWKDKDGNRQERTEWVSVVIMNDPLIRVAEQYLRKGSKVYLEGKLETRKWQDQSGADKYATEVVLRPYRGELVLLDARDDRPMNDPSRQSVPDNPPNYGGGYQSRADLSDEVPF